ncbi:MBL fold metallo-hydrolase [Paenibacillus sp. SYP-B3998]|uniref:MBL fold metallo-hydrolase n=1 Tax=Paenibacillus sp. SYP-B3998 TaxID=2678564 RepID=A0A6G4A410_9BACL|nr:MBL fold metallo-hydrolase [Paenibacillus sp. SYP-B3998]NEW08387.1 MBL fold metallo-hydrolase [Paenibacillus sp. SYP-B3998]
MMQLKVWGGAGEHGRSCYWIKKGKTSILLDCGVKRVGCGEYPLLESSEISNLDAVFLSHAHEDHSIALPLLYKYGYTGKVWTTQITAEQLPIYYRSWSNYVQQQSGELPYEEKHISQVTYAFLEETVRPLRWMDLSPTIRLCWGRSGHMLGSVWLLLEIEGKRLFYSGDYSEESLLLGTDSLQDLPGGIGGLHGAIIDGAYGVDAEPQAEKLAKLYSSAENVLTSGGHLLLPVPVSGRGQELMLLMRQQFPTVPIRVEQELLGAMELMCQQPEWLQPKAERFIAEALSNGSFEVIRDEVERERLLTEEQPSIFFTSDGMMQSPKARWYYEKLRSKPANGILITGHVAKGSSAHQLLAQSEEVRGCQMMAVRYKIHQGLPDVQTMLQYLPSSCPKLLVHAPKIETDLLIQQLLTEGYSDLLSLQPGDRVFL